MVNPVLAKIAYIRSIIWPEYMRANNTVGTTLSSIRDMVVSVRALGIMAV